MSDQLTLSELIKMLQTFEKKYGGDLPVYHTEFEGLTKSTSVGVEKITDKYDENEKVRVLVIGG